MSSESGSAAAAPAAGRLPSAMGVCKRRRNSEPAEFAGFGENLSHDACIVSSFGRAPPLCPGPIIARVFRLVSTLVPSIAQGIAGGPCFVREKTESLHVLARVIHFTGPAHALFRTVSSLLFTSALHAAASGHRVLFLGVQSHLKRTLVLPNPPPASAVQERISFKFCDSLEAVTNVLANLHRYPADLLPSVIVLDGFLSLLVVAADSYVMPKPPSSLAPSRHFLCIQLTWHRRFSLSPCSGTDDVRLFSAIISRTLALLDGAAQFCTDAWRRRPGTPSLSCAVLVGGEALGAPFWQKVDTVLRKYLPYVLECRVLPDSTAVAPSYRLQGLTSWVSPALGAATVAPESMCGLDFTVDGPRVELRAVHAPR